MTNDKLIEEAAKALYFEDCGVAALGDDAEPFREMARAAFAVFEKAHAPTDDEREALARVSEWADWLEDGAPLKPSMVTVIGMARRSEVPKPQGEPRHFAPYGSTNALCDETVPRQVAWDETTGEYADHRFTVKRSRTTCAECQWRMAPEPQGEPSDKIEFPFTHENVTIEQEDGGIWITVEPDRPRWLGPKALAALRAAGQVKP